LVTLAPVEVFQQRNGASTGYSRQLGVPRFNRTKAKKGRTRHALRSKGVNMNAGAVFQTGRAAQKRHPGVDGIDGGDHLRPNQCVAALQLRCFNPRRVQRGSCCSLSL
jgi:hypothetical protein